jgi:hypothetical protein
LAFLQAAKTAGLNGSREIKPKPLASLNHLTVPFSMLMFLPLLEFSAEEESLPR